jgi:chaperone required for assembly of F1-ATPase
VKRFYAETGVVEEGSAFLATLDGKPILTPGRARLELPTQGLAEAIAAEWAAQDQEIAPATMPLLRLAATAIDRVTSQRKHVIEQITAYGASDLLCYRAERPPELVERQRATWEPLLDEAAERFGARLIVTEGVRPVEQELEALAALRSAVAAHDAMALAALHGVTTTTGSLVIGLLLVAGALDTDAAWRAARVDEDFQIEKWSEDAEARTAAEAQKVELLAAARFLALIRG